MIKDAQQREEFMLEALEYIAKVAKTKGTPKGDRAMLDSIARRARETLKEVEGE